MCDKFSIQLHKYCNRFVLVHVVLTLDCILGCDSISAVGVVSSPTNSTADLIHETTLSHI